MRVANGIGPGAVRRATRAASANSFEAVAREWLHKMRPKWVDSHYAKIARRLDKDFLPGWGYVQLTILPRLNCWLVCGV